MAKSGLIKATKVHPNAPIFFSLPKTKALNIFNYQHEQLCADLYVAYETSGMLHTWEFSQNAEYESINLRPDRVSIIGEYPVFWEVDRGTEVLAKIHEKVEKYLELAKRHRDHKFYVIFSASPGRARSILLEVLIDIRSNAWFLVGDHQRVISDPLGKVFASPVRPNEAVSIAE
jgi:hypothetical protein